jgi:catechol 2,3-dioxygenase-like lactoylglutathione lyase family enzyme
VAALGLFALPVCGALALVAPDGLAYWPFVAFKAAAGGALGGLLTPFVADAAGAGGSVLAKAIPRFPVLDLAAALEFYENRLGFTKLFELDDYAGVARSGFELHLFRMNDPRLPEWTSCRVNVVGVDALYAECQRAGVVHPNGAITNQPWGFREFTVLDLCGNAIVFGERIG